jgi:hypothetical protein
VRNYLGQLEGLGYITIAIKVAAADFRLINMTKEGLQAIPKIKHLDNI